MYVYAEKLQKDIHSFIGVGHRACRNPGMLKSGIQARRDICRQYWLYFMYISRQLYSKIFLKMESSWNSIVQHSGVSACMLDTEHGEEFQGVMNRGG